MTDNSYLLDDRITAVHHHTDERKDAVLIPGPDGGTTVHSGPGAQTSASRHARPPVADLGVVLAESGVDVGAGERKRAFSRRTALRGGLIAAGAMLAPSLNPRYALSANAASTGTTIVVFMRGGADGLSIVAPVADADYYRRRPTIALAQDKVLPLSDTFGLNPAAAALMPFFRDGTVAFVHATGNPAPTRSHFDKQFLCETGAAAATVKSGWLGRHLTTSTGSESIFRAYSHSGYSAYALSATVPTPAMASLGAFKVAATGTAREQVLADLNTMWGSAGGPAEAAAVATMDASATVTTLAGTRYWPANGAKYPVGNAFSQSMMEIAQVMRSGIVPEVVCVDADGWDMHASMGDATSGQMHGRLSNFAAVLAAFMTDLGPERMASTTIIAMTEFGRTADENASKGTDHGFGSTMFAMGAGVNGGRVFGTHPGLAASNLDGGALAIGVDYRDALAELVTHRLGNAKNLPTVLPGYTPKPLGLFTA